MTKPNDPDWSPERRLEDVSAALEKAATDLKSLVEEMKVALEHGGGKGAVITHGD